MAGEIDDEMVEHIRAAQQALETAFEEMREVYRDAAEGSPLESYAENLMQMCADASGTLQRYRMRQVDDLG